jgi:hypothetical protein
MSVALVRKLRSVAALAAAATAVLTMPAAGQDAAPPKPLTSVQGGPVGTEVTVSLPGGLPGGARASVGFGGLSGGYELLGRAEIGPEGALFGTFTVPRWAERNLVYFFFVNAGGGTRLFSDPFIVTGPLGALQVTGSVIETVDGCVLMAGLDDTRYTLFGVTTAFAVGARVAVDGNLGVLDGVAPAGSRCADKPSIPVRVRTIRTR